MSSEPCLGLPPPGLLAGIEEYNRGEFFECHETLEKLWKAESRPIRYLYQGILQIGVACYHLQAGRYRPVVTLLERACGYLQPFAPTCMDVDVARLLADAARCLDEVKRLGRNGLGDFEWALIPRIEMRNEK
jgi:predicted metal-dependent hydrolase